MTDCCSTNGNGNVNGNKNDTNANNDHPVAVAAAATQQSQSQRTLPLTSRSSTVHGVVAPVDACDASDHCIPHPEQADTCIQLLDPLYGQSPAPLPAESTKESDHLELARKLVSEWLGTCLLVLVVVGSGISAETLSDDVGIQLTINSIATMGGLYCLITTLGPVSGAHFNPIVSMVDVLYGDMPLKNFALYVVCQIAGGICGAILANVQYDLLPAGQISTKDRFGWNLWISEIIASATLIWVIHGCLRTGNANSVPTAVAVWVGAGYFVFSSSIFANPAVTIGRMFSDTFAGIAPASAGVYIGCQIVGGFLGYGVVRFLYPSKPDQANLDDPLYRRVYVLVHSDFYAQNSYQTAGIQHQQEPLSNIAESTSKSA